MIEDLIKNNRSCRRFLQTEEVPVDTLRWLVNLARVSASAANLQPLKYILSNEPHRNEIIFSCLAWAAYLKDWPGPRKESGRQPTSLWWAIITSVRASAPTWGSRPRASFWGPGSEAWPGA